MRPAFAVEYEKSNRRLVTQQVPNLDVLRGRGLLR